MASVGGTVRAILKLFCEGRTDDGFRFCSGVENTIVDLEDAEYTEDYDKLMEYLGETIKIFERPCVNNNIITNAIYKIYTMGYIEDKLYLRIADFYKFHLRCGLILKAVFK